MKNSCIIFTYFVVLMGLTISGNSIQYYGALTGDYSSHSYTEPSKGIPELYLLGTSWGKPDIIRNNKLKEAKLYSWFFKNQDGMITERRIASVQEGIVKEIEIIRLLSL